MTPRHTATAALLALALASLAHAADPLEERIQRIENGLRRATIIRGIPDQTLKLADRMRYFKSPAVSVAVVHGGKLEWARAYGMADAESGRAATPDTLFQAASISKPVAALVALRLVEQGKLDLDEDVNVKLRSWKVSENEFTKTKKVTLRTLLSHNAGLTVHGFAGYERGAALPTLPQILNGSAPANSQAVVVDQKPGSGFRYSGGGYEVLEMLLQDVTGKPFEQLARELVLDPLGMRRSTFEQPPGAEYAKDTANGYRANGERIAGLYHIYPEKAAAGLWTTPSDLTRVILELQKPGAPFKPETIRTMLTRGAGDWALGIGRHTTRGRESFSHGGANAGFRCMMFGYLDSGDGAVVMANGDNASRLANELLSAIATEYGWVDYLPQEKTVIEVAPAVLQSYAGDYTFMGGPVVHIRVKDGRLTSTITTGDGVPMLAETPESFFDPDGTVPATRFVKTPEGAIELHAEGRTATRMASGPSPTAQSPKK